MRILLINYHCKAKTVYYRPGFFSRELVKRGHEPIVVCTSDTARFGIRDTLESGVRYLETPDLLWGKLRTGWDLWNLWNRVGLLRRLDVDLVHAFETRPATIHPVLARLKRAPTPLVIDWIDWWGRGGLIKEHRPLWYQWFFGGWETFYEEHFRTRADGTTVISRALGRRAEGLGVKPETIYWVPNGAALEQFPLVDPARHRPAYGLPPGAFIVADSALDVTKGIELAFRAVRLIRQRHPQILFIMTGGMAERLRRLAKREGVADNFRHFGRLPYEQVGEVLSCANAFVMPYPDCPANRGRWPGRIGSYLAMGRPVVSNPVGEVAPLLQEQGIGLAALETPASLAEQINRLIEQPDLAVALGRKARAAAEKMTWPLMTDRLEQCYRETASRWSSMSALRRQDYRRH